MVTAIGLLAALLTTGCWLPQLLRSWRTRSTADISWYYLGALGLGIASWLTYGLLTGDLALVLANVFTGAAVVAVMAMKAQFDHQLVRPRSPRPIPSDGDLVDALARGD